MAIANRQLYPYHLEREISKIWLNAYADEETEYTKIAKVQSAPAGNTYTEAEVSGLGSFREMVEGGAPDFDTPVEGHKKTINYTKFGLAFQITEEMVADAIHPNIYKMPQTLARSAVNTQELQFWDLLNGAHDTHTAWDGNYIVHAAHTTLKSGDTINNDVQADLSETSFQAAFEYFDEMVDEAGLPVKMTLDWLLVPTSSRWIANRLMRQRGGISTSGTSPDLSGNDMTTNPSNGYVDSWKLHVSRFIDDDDSWFALSKDHDLRFYWKKRPKLQSGDDFLTDNALFKMVMRFAAECFDYKGIYGSQGAG
jgi:hypothetical protein